MAYYEAGTFNNTILSPSVEASRPGTEFVGFYLIPVLPLERAQKSKDSFLNRELRLWTIEEEDC